MEKYSNETMKPEPFKVGKVPVIKEKKVEPFPVDKRLQTIKGEGLTKKQARQLLEALLSGWNTSKMDKQLFLIEYNGRVQDGEFN